MSFSLSGLSQSALALPRLSKRLIVALVDGALCAATVYLAVYLRMGAVPEPGGTLWALLLGSVVLALPIFRAFGLYREIFSQAGFLSVIEIGRACAIYGLVFAAIFTFAGFAGIPRTVGVIQPILLFLGVAASRVFARSWLSAFTGARSRIERPRALIYGAGEAGRQMAAALSNTREIQVVGFLDDDPKLVGAVINGVPIHAGSAVADVAERLGATDVLLAMPSAPQRRRKAVIDAIRDTQLRVRTLPGLMDLAHGRLSLSDIRELDVGDLLGRTSVPPDPALLGRNIHGKTLLVTGAGGSIGSQLCRQALAVGPARLLLLEVSEFALYAIHQELLAKLPEVAADSIELVPLLGSVCDGERLAMILDAWAPDTIYHAAAYKHVPLVEHNPAEGIRNNVFGTLALAEAAGRAGTPDVVLISTDKAVRPTNVMGTTKRVAELVMQAMNAHYPATRFSMVRFGNVLGSSGSVVPLFREQIRAGGPITITDRRIIRYFMTIPEAAQLVIQAGAMAQGGEVFVLDMGEPVKIADLARNMVELSGLKLRDAANPDGDIELQEVGLRPGEKLYEELLIGDHPTTTAHPRILMAHEAFLPLSELDGVLRQLKAAVEANAVGQMLMLLLRLVPEYRPEHGPADFVRAQLAARAAAAAGRE